jgi:hypothetical protein
MARAAWLDRMVRRVRDADTEEEAREVTKDFIDPTSGAPTGGGGAPDDGDTHIHLHMGKGGEGGGGGMAGDDDPPIDVGGGGQPDVQQLAAAVAELLQRVEQLEGGGGGNGGNGEEGDDGEDVELEDPETKDRRRFRMRRGDRMTRDDDIPVPERLGEEMVGETDLPGLEGLKQGGSTGDRRKFRDRYARTHDSADAEDLWQDTMAAAEILQPGVRVPTFDARLTLESTAKRLCAFRRRVLDHALSDENTKQIINESIGTIDTARLTCDSVKMAFNAAASQIRLLNNRGQMRPTVTRDNRTGAVTRRGPPSISEMNANAKEFWARNNGASR